MSRIDLNADVGESFGAFATGSDEQLFENVTSANVACGFHAGDPSVIDRTVKSAVERGVAVGAHPGYFDLRGFGRREMRLPASEVEADVVYQTGALLAFARAHGTTLTHVKPHGALYNQAVDDPQLAFAIARGIARVSRELVLVGLAGSQAMREAAARAPAPRSAGQGRESGRGQARAAARPRPRQSPKQLRPADCDPPKRSHDHSPRERLNWREHYGTTVNGLFRIRSQPGGLSSPPSGQGHEFVRNF